MPPILCRSGKPAPVNFDAEIEIDEIIFLCQLPVGQGIGGKGRFVSAGLHNEVVISTHSLGNDVIRHVRDGVEELCALFLGCFFEFLELCAARFEFCHTRLGGFCLFLLAGLHEGTDILGKCLLFGEHSVEFRLCALAFAVNVEHRFDGLSGSCEMFLFQAANHGFFIFVDLFNRQHVGYLSYLVSAKVAQ